MAKPRSFRDYLLLVIFFYKTIGEDLLQHRTVSNVRWFVMRIGFVLGALNVVFVQMGEMIYFYKAIQSTETMMKSFVVMPCSGMIFLSAIKHGAVFMHKLTLRDHFEELERICPKSAAQQKAYNISKYERNVQPVLLGQFLVLVGCALGIGLYPIGKSWVKYMFMGAPTFEREFGYPIWYPYDVNSSLLLYWLSFLSQVHLSFFLGIMYLTADLLLVISITQICMHFDFISDCLEGFTTNPKPESEDMEYLKWLIEHHNKCFELSEQLNSIFNFALLLNFGAASFTICFVGFVITSSTAEDMARYAFFLLALMIQVFVMCYYGHYLMDASLRVGEAAYNQNWYDRSRPYKRMLQFLITRSQKPASLHAQFIPPISLNTFMSVISMSYQFFALLRTTYNN